MDKHIFFKKFRKKEGKKGYGQTGPKFSVSKDIRACYELYSHYLWMLYSKNS